MQNTRLSGANASYIATNIINKPKAVSNNTQPTQNQQTQQQSKKSSSGFATFVLLFGVVGSFLLQIANMQKKPDSAAQNMGDIQKINDDIQKLFKQLEDVLNKIGGLEKTNDSIQKTFDSKITSLNADLVNDKNASMKLLKSLQDALKNIQTSINQNAKNENKATQATIKGILDKITELLNKNQEALLETTQKNQKEISEAILTAQKSLQQNISQNQKEVFESFGQLQKIVLENCNNETSCAIGDKEILELQTFIETLLENSNKRIDESITKTQQLLSEAIFLCQEENINIASASQEKITEILSKAMQTVNQGAVESKEAIITTVKGLNQDTINALAKLQELLGETTNENKQILAAKIETLVQEMNKIASESSVQVQKDVNAIKTATQEEISRASSEIQDSFSASFGEFQTKQQTETVMPLKTKDASSRLFEKTDSLEKIYFDKEKGARLKDSRLPYSGIIEDILPDENTIRLEYKKGQLIKAQKFNPNGEELYTKTYEKETSSEGSKLNITNTVKKFVNGENIRTYTDKRVTDFENGAKTNRSFYIIDKDNVHKTKTEVVKCMPQKDGFVLLNALNPNRQKVVTKYKDSIETTFKEIPKKDKGILPDGYRMFVLNNKAIK